MSYVRPPAQQNPWGAPANPWGNGAVPQRAMMPPGAGYPVPQMPGYPAPQGAYAPAPARRTSSSTGILKGVLVVLGVVFFSIILVKALSGGGGTTTTTTNPPVTTTAPKPTTTQTTKPSPTTTPTSPPTTTTPTQPPGGYQNADYTVPDPNLSPPDLPLPETYGEATDWMINNAFYDETIPVPVECQIPDINPMSVSKTDLQTYLNDSVACLMRVWGPQLQDAGFNAARPSVTVYSGQIQSPCGKMPNENALYCSADQQVYYATDLPDLFPSQATDPMVPVAVIAHEFGHAIQAQSGILYSSIIWQNTESGNGDDATANDLSRRTEQQADCFSGAFIQAISQAAGVSADEQTSLAQVFYAIGDDVLSGDPNYDGDHGHGANRVHWFQTGLGATTAGECNTFASSVTTDQVR